MHVASAMDIPLIALFGPTQKERFAPKNANVITTKTKSCYNIYGKFENCKKNQMNEISTKEVLMELGKLHSKSND